MKPYPVAFVGLVLAGRLALLSAQAPPSASPPQQAPAVFRSGVELVRLDVRIVDAEGRPITDLRPEEVTVHESGRPRPLLLFQRVAQPAGTYLETARRTIGAEVSTNQGAPRGQLWVFVFDQNHITPGNEQRARMAVERLLRTRVRPGDRVALYAVPGPGPALPLSPSVSAAIAELPRVRGTLDRQVGVGIAAMSLFEAYQVVRGDQGVAQRILTRATEGGAAIDVSGRVAAARQAASGVATGAGYASDSFTQQVQLVTDAARGIVVSTDAQTAAFLSSLADIIRELARIEGRKSVVLVSEGFFADNVSRDVERVAAAAAEAYAVIYALDINRRGLDVSAAAPTGAEPAAEVQSRLESLSALAAETSGELVLDAGPQIDRVLERIAASSQDYYIVGFEPSAEALGSRHTYRRVQVKVSRPGARVATRTGYALSDAAGPADRRRSIDAALAAPFPQQGLPLEMTTYVLRGTSPGSQRVFMSLQAELPVAERERPTSADVVFVVRHAENGRVMASGTDVIPLSSAPAPGRSTAPGRYQVQFDLPAGPYLMRAAVREPGGGTGTVDRRFDVRALDGVDLTASDLVIGRRQEQLPVRPVGYTEEGLVGMLEIYGRRSSDLENATVTVELFATGAEAAVRSMRAELGEVRPLTSGAARSATVAMPLTGVAPGDYVVRATLRARGETAAEMVRQVRIVSGRAPAAAVTTAEAVTPLMVANGDLGRRLVRQVRDGAASPTLQKAADFAAAGSWDQALAALDSAGTKGDAGVESLRGLALFAKGRFAEAAEAMDRAVARDSKASLPAFFLGWIQVAGGNAPAGISAWRMAITIDSALVSAYLALADTYVKLAHPELAIEVLRQGIRANPASAELRLRLEEMERR
jgi:VWFA-related protein